MEPTRPLPVCILVVIRRGALFPLIVISAGRGVAARRLVDLLRVVFLCCALIARLRALALAHFRRACATLIVRRGVLCAITTSFCACAALDDWAPAKLDIRAAIATASTSFDWVISVSLPKREHFIRVRT